MECFGFRVGSNQLYSYCFLFFRLPIPAGQPGTEPGMMGYQWPFYPYIHPSMANIANLPPQGAYITIGMPIHSIIRIAGSLRGRTLSLQPEESKAHYAMHYPIA